MPSRAGDPRSGPRCCSGCCREIDQNRGRGRAECATASSCSSRSVLTTASSTSPRIRWHQRLSPRWRRRSS
eukprot:5854322-Prymnesium_polylepis.1